MKKIVLRGGVVAAAVAACAASLVFWWSDGAWNNGSMPTDGMIKVVALAGSGSLSVLAAAWIGRRLGGERPRR